MILEIKVPSAGESITQVELARWMVEDGAYVEKDQEIAEIDSDKATLTINAGDSGKIRLTAEEGSTLEPGKVIGEIDTDAKPNKVNNKQTPAQAETKKTAAPSPAADIEAKPEGANKGQDAEKAVNDFTFSPQAQKLIDQMDLPLEQALKNPDNKRITKQDILAAIAKGIDNKSVNVQPSEGHEISSNSYWDGSRNDTRQKMSTLRLKVGERLVAVKNQTAMLTTFNEVDMSAIIALRKKHQKNFTEKYGMKLGFMSFFAKAITESIPFFPVVNGQIEDNTIVIPSYADVGIAVSTPKGLMVPVIRNAESLSIPQLEQQISILAEKARNNKINIDELTGGTISVTNGGIFGSMLSTPILNPPQSAILGMHNIIERPVAINGHVEIRPMMYLALSYDHRIIDGRESVGFLVKVKEMIENPERMIMHGKDAATILLGL